MAWEQMFEELIGGTQPACSAVVRHTPIMEDIQDSSPWERVHLMMFPNEEKHEVGGWHTTEKGQILDG